MRILHILDHSLPHHSGYVFRTLALMREQRALGWDPVLLTAPRQGPTQTQMESIEGFDIYRTPFAEGDLPSGRVARTWRETAMTKKRIEAVAKEIKPDLLHAHSPVLNASPALKAQTGLPVVYEIRAFWEDAAVDHKTTQEGSLRYRLTRQWETKSCRKAQHVFTICQGLKDDLIARGIPQQKVSLIPNAVDIDAFDPIDARDAQLEAELGLAGKAVLGFLGSFYAYEGLDLVVGALPQIAKTVPNICLLLVGGGPEEERLKAQVAQLGLEDKVLFVGRVPQSEVRRYYSLADALVFARHSMRLTETVTPLKPLEAMALKKPVIASDVGGHHELIRDGETGLLFPAGDSSALAQTVCRLLGDDALQHTLKETGRQYVSDERTWARSAANYGPVYERLTGKTKAAA